MAVTENAWDGSASRFTDQQWAKSCVLDMADCSGMGMQMTAKTRYKLPIREPDGTLNVHGLGSAAASLAGARTPLVACKAAKVAAAKRLASAYDEAGLDAPESVETLAGAPDSESNGG